MNKLLIGFTLLSTTALGCDRGGEKTCPEPPKCKEAECPKVPGLTDPPKLAARQARSIELHMGGKTYPGALLGDDQVMVNVMGSGGTTTTVFYSLGGPLDTQGWGPETRLHMMPPSEVASFQTPRGAELAGVLKVKNLIAKSASRWGPGGLVWECRDLVSDCGNFTPPLQPDIVPDPGEFEIIAIKEPVATVKVQRCGSRFGECAGDLKCEGEGLITLSGGVKTMVDCCVKSGSTTCVPKPG